MYTTILISCVQYHEPLEARYCFDPNRTQLRYHLNEHFTYLSKNLQNYYERIDFEGPMIRQMKPTLNEQLKFRKSNVICGCIMHVIYTCQGPF